MFRKIKGERPAGLLGVSPTQKPPGGLSEGHTHGRGGYRGYGGRVRQGPIIPKVLDIDPFHGRELALWVGAARSAMPHGFPGHRSSVATTPEGQFAPPKAALKGRLSAPFGYMGRPACGAPHRGARPRLARRPLRAVKWVNIKDLWYNPLSSHQRRHPSASLGPFSDLVSLERYARSPAKS